MINFLKGKFGTVNLLHLRNAILEWLDTWKRSVYLLSFLECCAMNTVSMVGAVWNYTFFNTQLTCGFIFSLQPLFAWIRKIQASDSTGNTGQEVNVSWDGGQTKP